MSSSCCSCAPSLSARPGWLCSPPRMPNRASASPRRRRTIQWASRPAGSTACCASGPTFRPTKSSPRQLTIDKFVYDPTTQKGELAVNATKGVFRVIGGRISKTSAITVTTPSATMGIRGGIMVFGVQASATTSIFVYGNSMTVTANGVTQTVTVPGLSVSTPTGGTPGAPTIAVQGSLAAALAALAGNNTAAAATVDAINTLVANNLGNAVTLQALIQAIVVANTATPITTTTPTTNLTVTVVENPNQTQSSPN